MEFWFRRQFNLAPTDQRFLDATIDQIETEYWAHEYAARRVTDDYEDEDFDLEEVMAKMEQEASGGNAAPDINNPDDWEDV